MSPRDTVVDARVLPGENNGAVTVTSAGVFDVVVTKSSRSLLDPIRRLFIKPMRNSVP
jgi:hypothetical protein